MKTPSQITTSLSRSIRRFGAIIAIGLATFQGAHAAMLHHWDFNSGGTDSISGSNVTLVGAATISGGSLNIPGAAKCHGTMDAGQRRGATVLLGPDFRRADEILACSGRIGFEYGKDAGWTRVQPAFGLIEKNDNIYRAGSGRSQ